MSQVIRFFHIRAIGTTHGGATARVVGDTSSTSVQVQIAHCRSDEQFVKKMGREQAEKATAKTIPLRYLPQELGRVWKKAAKRDSYEYEADYSFSLKYFLPKE